MTDKNDSTPITLPGTIPGLLRECSPVAISVAELPLRRGVVGQLYPPTLVGVWVHGEPSPAGRTKYGTAEVINQHWLALDLKDETGRDHAAWWAGDAESSRRPDASASVPDGYVVEDAGDFGVRVTIYRRRNAHVYTCGEVPALGRLNLYGPTPLPDGSSRTEALALQAVCLHIAAKAKLNEVEGIPLTILLQSSSPMASSLTKPATFHDGGFVGSTADDEVGVTDAPRGRVCDPARDRIIDGRGH